MITVGLLIMSPAMSINFDFHEFISILPKVFKLRFIVWDGTFDRFIMSVNGCSIESNSRRSIYGNVLLESIIIRTLFDYEFPTSGNSPSDSNKNRSFINFTFTSWFFYFKEVEWQWYCEKWTILEAVLLWRHLLWSFKRTRCRVRSRVAICGFLLIWELM